jgi:hypothetical protein
MRSAATLSVPMKVT